jgi:protein-S-isoprenylcysteine O-methyltransferase Ste14
VTRLPTLGPRGEGWFVLQVVLGLAILVAGEFVHVPLATPLRFAGIVAGLIGAAAAGVGLLALGRWASPLPRPTGGPLRSTGIYRFVRHPIYTGVILLAAGYSLWVASVLAGFLTLLLAIFFDLKARREEAWLAASRARRRPDLGDPSNI